MDKPRLAARILVYGGLVVSVYPLYLFGVLLIDLIAGQDEFLTAVVFDSKRQIVVYTLSDWLDSFAVSIFFVGMIEVLMRVVSWKMGFFLLVLGIVMLIASAYLGAIRACIFLTLGSVLASVRWGLHARHSI